MTKPKRPIKNTTFALHLQRIATMGGYATRKKYGNKHYKKLANKRWAAYRKQKLEEKT